jgi:hypothetical protein
VQKINQSINISFILFFDLFVLEIQVVKGDDRVAAFIDAINLCCILINRSPERTEARQEMLAKAAFVFIHKGGGNLGVCHTLQLAKLLTGSVHYDEIVPVLSRGKTLEELCQESDRLQASKKRKRTNDNEESASKRIRLF